MLQSSQAKVVELHNTLTQHAHRLGITDQQLMVDNVRMSSQLEGSMQYCQECEGCALCHACLLAASHVAGPCSLAVTVHEVGNAVS